MYYLHFPFRSAINFVISLITFFTVGIFFIYHVILVYYNISSLEHKYKLYKKEKLLYQPKQIQSKFSSEFSVYKTQDERNVIIYLKSKKDYISSIIQCLALNLESKQLYINFKKVFGSTNILEIYWPEYE
jgi:hypothetical protein